MITPYSRYNFGTIVRLPNSSGVYNLSVLRPVAANTTTYRLYIWREGDRPDLVAFNQLGDATLWWSIFDINPEMIYPLNIPAGTVVRIPLTPITGVNTLNQ